MSNFKNVEEALKRINEINTILESDEADLEKALELYAEATEAAAYCTKELARAKQKITELRSAVNSDD